MHCNRTNVRYFDIILFIDDILINIGQQLYIIGETSVEDAEKKRLIQDALTDNEEVLVDYISQSEVDLRDMLAGYMNDAVEEDICYSNTDDDREKIVIKTSIPKYRFPSYIGKNISKLSQMFIVSKSISLFFFNIDVNVSGQWEAKANECLRKIGTDMNKRVVTPVKRKLSTF